MKKIVFITTAILSVLFAGCSNKEQIKNIKVGPVNEEKLVESQNEFGFELYKELDKGEEDVFISPYSISILLTMVADGAVGKTQEEMYEVLQLLGYSNEEVRREAKKLIELTNTLNNGVKVEVANSLWIDNNFEVGDKYIRDSKKYFESEVNSRNFGNALTVTEINRWINSKTKGKIDKMLDSLSPEDRMVLVNAIYFKGEWREKFDKNLTSKGNFYKEDGSIKEVEYMRGTRDIGYYTDDRVDISRLAYGNGEAAMYLFLPKEGISSEEFVDSLDNAEFESYISRLTYNTSVDIEIPKFDVEYGKKELKPPLNKMGMERVFGSKAELDGIAKDIYLGAVDHKAVISVDEKGSEAAAVTTGIIKAVSFVENHKFVANRPFFFVIRDEESKAILFMGTYRGNEEGIK